MIKILQIGEGNFLRAFAEHYIQLANDMGIYDGSVAVCQPRTNTDVINALNDQSRLYNIVIKGKLNGEIVDRVKTISCIEKCIDTVSKYDELVKVFTSKELETVISNTTEAGICFNKNDKKSDSPLVSFPGKVTALLYERYKKKRKGLVFLPVELIENNGEKLKECIIRYADLWKLGDSFKEYVETKCHFCNTLVDRIVSGRTEFNDDKCAVACEPYASWLIEADDEAAKVIPFTRVGMGAEFVDDIKPYRERKVKILNGTHTMSVLAAYNAGYEIVRDMVNDDVFSEFIKKALNDEILKTINLSSVKLKGFTRNVLERFDNPFIDHKLLDISLNSVSKFKARCLCSYIDYCEKFSKPPEMLSFSLAALINFYEDYENKPYPVKDVKSVLDFFSAEHEDIVFDVMSNSDFWGRDLTEIDGAYDKVKKRFEQIKTLGVKEAMKALLDECCDRKLFKINENDNVAIALEPLKRGYKENGITIRSDIPFGHKVLLKDMICGEDIIKYGCPIGHLIKEAKAGSHIHEHNLRTNLSDIIEYKYSGAQKYKISESKLTFDGYKRENGCAATRNEIWIIPTVGCVNNTAQKLEKIGNDVIGDSCDGVFAYTHPFGCSQLGDDQENTRKILAALAQHPNAGGALIVSLGCENTNVKTFKRYLDSIDERRIKFLVTQDCEDELEEGKKLIGEIYEYIKQFKREPIPISKLVVGFKCGGSDAFSGITANALCGKLTDRLTSFGASAILTEVPEMFGAEHILMERAENRQTFNDIVNMINDFKKYFFSHNQECYENPSPGNHDGGITTLEEKSLGCIQKGGESVVTGVLEYGERCKKHGLNLLTGPGNDIVSVTNLTAAGANIILFTTGRGTPLGAPVPTIKLSSNTALFEKKANWIDFNAGELINGASFSDMTDELLKLVIETASGKRTKNEQNGYREISIFKDGVIM